MLKLEDKRISNYVMDTKKKLKIYFHILIVIIVICYLSILIFSFINDKEVLAIFKFIPLILFMITLFALLIFLDNEMEYLFSLFGKNLKCIIYTSLGCFFLYWLFMVHFNNIFYIWYIIFAIALLINLLGIFIIKRNIYYITDEQIINNIQKISDSFDNRKYEKYCKRNKLNKKVVNFLILIIVISSSFIFSHLFLLLGFCISLLIFLVVYTNNHYKIRYNNKAILRQLTSIIFYSIIITIVLLLRFEYFSLKLFPDINNSELGTLIVLSTYLFIRQIFYGIKYVKYGEIIKQLDIK